MVEVGTTKDQGLYNKPLAAVRQGALDAGTLPQYSTVLIVGYKIRDSKFSFIISVAP